MSELVLFDRYLPANGGDTASAVPAFMPDASGHIIGYRHNGSAKMQKLRFVTEKPVKEISLIPRHEKTEMADWNIGLVALVLLLIVMTKTLFPRRFRQLSGALVGSNYLNQLLREWNPLRSLMGVFFILAYIVVFGLFLQRLLIYFAGADQTLASPLTYLAMAAGVGAFLLLRMLLVSFFSFLFRTQEVSMRYLTNQVSYFMITTLLLLPILFVLIYNPFKSVFYMSIILVLVLLLFRFYRSFIVGLSNRRFSILYLFLYLCALEIVPFLLLIKLVLLFVSGEV